MKILPVGAELFHASRKTDIGADINDEVDSLFSQFLEHVRKPVSR